MHQRLPGLLVALIFLHLTGVCQSQEYVKKTLTSPLTAFKSPNAQAPSNNNSHYNEPVSNSKPTPFGPFSYRNLQHPNSPKVATSYKVYQYQYFSAARDWGIICQKEWKLEKATGVPFRFRLGSLEYVDRLEAKTK